MSDVVQQYCCCNGLPTAGLVRCSEQVDFVCVVAQLASSLKYLVYISCVCSLYDTWYTTKSSVFGCNMNKPVFYIACTGLCCLQQLMRLIVHKGGAYIIHIVGPVSAVSIMIFIDIHECIILTHVLLWRTRSISYHHGAVLVRIFPNTTAVLNNSSSNPFP